MNDAERKLALSTTPSWIYLSTDPSWKYLTIYWHWSEEYKPKLPGPKRPFWHAEVLTEPGADEEWEHVGGTLSKDEESTIDRFVKVTRQRWNKTYLNKRVRIKVWR